MDQQRSGAMEVVQSVAPPPDALPQPCGMNAAPVPGWAVRLMPGCMTDCRSEATNTDAVEGAARVVDAIIMTHLKARYRPFYGAMVKMDVMSYKERVIASGTIPEFDNYFPFLGVGNKGELISPTEENMIKLVEEKKSGKGLPGDVIKRCSFAARPAQESRHD